MSRLNKFTHALASGYMQTGVNVLYTLASVPLALHFLSTDEFGLWQVAVALAGYLLLVDFGMTGAAARILIDHKDDPAGGAYGSVVKISFVVFFIQGLAIAFLGAGVSYWLPALMNIPPSLHRTLFFLAAGQCVLQGIFFPARGFWNLGVAHQRYDLYNYAQVGVLIVQFGALWLSFRMGAGIYSVLIANGVGLMFGFCCGWRLAVLFHFLPARGCWGGFDFKLFKEIFFFGGDQFLMAVGNQLLNASQILVISHTLGLSAAAIWSVASKPFVMAQQLVGRIFAFACSPLCEMIVRSEHDRYLKRFRDIVIVSACAAIFTGGGIAMCNESFLHVWTRGRISWNPLNDFLFALWFVLTCVSGLHVVATTLTKQIGRMRYIFFCEGVIFVTASIIVAPHFGISGIIVSAIVANILCSGIFGIRRTVAYFHVPASEAVFGWLAGPIKFFLLEAVILIGCRFLTESFPPAICLITNASISGLSGLWLLWRVGLTPELRDEAKTTLSKIQARLPKWTGRRPWINP